MYAVTANLHNICTYELLMSNVDFLLVSCNLSKLHSKLHYNQRSTDYTNNTKPGGRKLLGTTATNPLLEKILPNDTFFH